MASTQIQRQQVINVKITFCKLLYIHKRGSKYMYDVEESLNLPDPNSFQVTHAHKRVSDKHSERSLSLSIQMTRQIVQSTEPKFVIPISEFS